MIEPLDKEDFMDQMRVSEQYGDYSDDPVERFYEWMYRNQEGVVQTCAFPVPPEGKTNSDMGEGKWIHARTYNEFEEFCSTHSGLWMYHVYSGVNTLAETPEYGRGSTEIIDNINILSFDIELAKDSYCGSTKEEVWWTYQYALAEIKFMEQEYDVWPLVVMSENGIHLHYQVDFDCTDELLHNKQHVYSKFITKQAMNNKYTSSIESKSPDDLTFDQDDVSDPVRVMKVPGTKGIKSENGRLCGIIHQPNAIEAGVITPSDIPHGPDEIKQAFNETSKTSNSSRSSTEKLESVDTTPSDLSSELTERVEYLVRNDETFADYWEGTIDKNDDRSEKEFAFILKMLNHDFTKQQVVDVMWASGMEKWREETDHYREKTLAEAVDWFDGTVQKDSTNGSFSFSER